MAALNMDVEQATTPAANTTVHPPAKAAVHPTAKAIIHPTDIPPLNYNSTEKSVVSTTHILGVLHFKNPKVPANYTAHTYKILYS